jgi:hypothetical protein
MRRSRLLIGLKWKGVCVFFTFSAAVIALIRSSSILNTR